MGKFFSKYAMLLLFVVMSLGLVAPQLIGLQAFRDSGDITRPARGISNSLVPNAKKAPPLTFPATSVFIRDARLMDDAAKLQAKGKTPCFSPEQVTEVRETYQRIVYTFENHKFLNATTPTEQTSWQARIDKEIAAAKGKLAALDAIEKTGQQVLADKTGKQQCVFVETINPNRKTVRDIDK